MRRLRERWEPMPRQPIHSWQAISRVLRVLLVEAKVLALQETSRPQEKASFGDPRCSGGVIK